MKRNIVKSIAAIATVTLGFAFIAIPHKSNPQLTDVQLANIEALAQSESMLIECDNLSPIIKCKKCVCIVEPSGQLYKAMEIQED